MVVTSDYEILQALATQPDPVATSTELAEQVEISQQAVYKRLQRFESEGLVRSKSVGASGTVWYLTPEGRQRLNDLQSCEASE